MQHEFHVRVRRPEEGDQEGWLVSYADLITLLFIFFSLLLSISAVNRSKFEMITSKFNQASTTSLTELKKQLDASIQKQSLQSRVTTEMTEDGLQIRFDESVLFATAEAHITESGLKLLTQLGEIFKTLDPKYSLAVEGHTDSLPIHTKAYSSNWLLSADRAVNVLHLLKDLGMNEKKMMVRAYADNRPLDGDASKNRRVNLLIF